MIAKAQGATEYLVLLAVVLIVALVSVALLGFFPSMASDAQITQSQMYWKSASPIAITEAMAGAEMASGTTYPYLRMKNNGAYPIRITAIIGGDGGKATTFYGYGICGTSATTRNISDWFYLAPGEESYLAWTGTAPGVPCSRYCNYATSASGGNRVGGATSLCQNSTTSPGTLVVPNFGFEYIMYIEGQQVTKREMGKSLVIKCGPPV